MHEDHNGNRDYTHTRLYSGRGRRRAAGLPRLIARVVPAAPLVDRPNKKQRKNKQIKECDRRDRQNEYVKGLSLLSHDLRCCAI
jgi:hypothetical protein